MSVGQTLAEARTERGMTVQDVSEATRIRGGLIRAIENDDFRPCGGDVYARGHIRSISRVLGIDAAPLITEFDAAHEVEPTVVAPAPATAPPETDRRALAHSERRSPNWAAAMVVALLVVIAVAAYSAFGTGGGGNKNNLAGSHNSTVNSGGQHNSQPATKKSGPPQPQKSLSANNDLTNKAVLQIRATTATTWLEVSNAATGTTLFEGNLLPGQHKRFIKPYALSFVIGNAPAVDVVVNGKDVGAPQSSGNVARGKIQPGSQQIQQA